MTGDKIKIDLTTDKEGLITNARVAGNDGTVTHYDRNASGKGFVVTYGHMEDQIELDKNTKKPVLDIKTHQPIHKEVFVVDAIDQNVKEETVLKALTAKEKNAAKDGIRIEETIKGNTNVNTLDEALIKSAQVYEAKNPSYNPRDNTVESVEKPRTLPEKVQDEINDIKRMRGEKIDEKSTSKADIDPAMKATLEEYASSKNGGSSYKAPVFSDEKTAEMAATKFKV